MSDQPELDAPERLPLPLVLAVLLVVGGLLDLFCLLLLPLRVSGHLVPVGPLLVLAVNGLLGTVASRATRTYLPAQVLLGVAVLLSVVGALRGPGGDLLVTRDLQTMYLLFVIGALLGAGVPLFRRPRPR